MITMQDLASNAPAFVKSMIEFYQDLGALNQLMKTDTQRLSLTDHRLDLVTRFGQPVDVAKMDDLMKDEQFVLNDWST